MNDKNSKLRIAVILDELAMEPWQTSIFDAIKDPKCFDVSVVTKSVHRSRGNDRARMGAENTAINPLSVLIDRFEKKLSTRLFRIVFGKRRGASDRPVKFDDQSAQNSSWQKSLSVKGSAAQLKTTELDLILDLTQRPDLVNHVSLTENARLGRWFIKIGEGAANSNSSALPGFHEVYTSTPNIHVELCAEIKPGDAPFAIKRGCFRTFLWSWNENERQLHYKAASLITDMLREITTRSEARPSPLGQRISTLRTPATAIPPGPAVLAYALVKCIWRIGSETVQRSITNERWSLHIAKGSPQDVDLRSADAIEPPSNSYWADPFFIERDGRTYIFFEEYLYPKKKGVISVAEFSRKNGHWSAGEAQIIIERDYHMSYPFMFEHSGELYMIPESNADHCIGLWRCENFPHDWQKISNLMENVSATDTTLQYHDGKWWMFTNLDRLGLGDHCSELHIFSTTDPTGRNWTAHPENPVIRDARSARMAGPLIRSNEHGLIRPAQINERYYGHALALYQITELNDLHYRETLVRRVDPDWRKGIYRNHHISSLGDYLVVDGCRDRLKLEPIFKPSPTNPSKSAIGSGADYPSIKSAPSGDRENRQMQVEHGQ